MFDDFEPHPLVRGGQLQTMVAHFTSKKSGTENVIPFHVPLPDGDQLLVHHDVPKKSDDDLPMIVTLHGLGGCSESSYNLRLAYKLNQLGYDVLRFNHRGCGPGARKLAKQIYHAGRTDDIWSALKFFEEKFPGRTFLPIGFSLSGNALLMLLGQLGQDLMPAPLPQVQAALAVCPPLDLEHCSQALARMTNKHLDYYYTKLLVATTNERAKVFEDIEHPIWPKKMTLRKFDELFTAPEGGFGDLANYYNTCSSRGFVDKIKIPTHILGAKDDPIIPLSSYDDVVLSPVTKMQLTDSGGHMGFLSRTKTRFGDHRWMDEAICRFVEAV